MQSKVLQNNQDGGDNYQANLGTNQKMKTHTRQCHNHLMKLPISHFLSLLIFLALLTTTIKAHCTIMNLLLIFYCYCLKHSFLFGKSFYSMDKLVPCYTDFYLDSGSESLPTKKLTIFCPFLFGAPHQISFSVYVLGRQVDSGFLPNDYSTKISHLFDTLCSLKLCLGIYDEKLLKSIKLRQDINDSGNDCNKTYEIDSKRRQEVSSISLDRKVFKLHSII